MWLLVVDRPYYPSVEEFDTQAAAEQAMAVFIGKEGHANGQHETIVYVAETRDRRTTKTYY